MLLKTTSTSIAALAIFLGASAHAADLGGGAKDGSTPGIFDAPQTVNWTGFYVGGRAGYGHSAHELSVDKYDSNNETGCTTETGTPAGSGGVPAAVPGVPGSCDKGWSEVLNLSGLDSSGFTGGGQVGFDVQRGRFVGGIFGSYDFSNAETTISGHDMPEIALIEQGNSWSIGARAGLLVNPRTLVYALAAYTQTEFTFAAHDEDEADKDVDFSGITAGAGVEFALTNNIFMGIEGTHTFYGKEELGNTCGDDPCGGGDARLNDEIGETKVMGTLKIKLNSGLPNFMD